MLLLFDGRKEKEKRKSERERRRGRRLSGRQRRRRRRRRRRIRLSFSFILFPSLGRPSSSSSPPPRDVFFLDRILSSKCPGGVGKRSREERGEREERERGDSSLPLSSLSLSLYSSAGGWQKVVRWVEFLSLSLSLSPLSLSLSLSLFKVFQFRIIFLAFPVVVVSSKPSPP